MHLDDLYDAVFFAANTAEHDQLDAAIRDEMARHRRLMASEHPGQVAVAEAAMKEKLLAYLRAYNDVQERVQATMDA